MQRAAAFNRAPERRAAAAALLAPEPGAAAAAAPPATPVVAASAWQAPGAFTANGTPTAAAVAKQARRRLLYSRPPRHKVTAVTYDGACAHEVTARGTRREAW